MLNSPPLVCVSRIPDSVEVDEDGFGRGHCSQCGHALVSPNVRFLVSAPQSYLNEPIDSSEMPSLAAIGAYVAALPARRNAEILNR